ncbi:PREDICTED: vacuolar protein sorting-associated protein 52 homolog [Dufourea novaeangliae]|uniref:Vacuolar protein sorting-associated protein 52 homolog n=1 Tax=Dufourea novaeangliae TaxID=178035 RepID=A0A154P7J8_DUFNO|nr:PREDICTED: vacuolar protein sorting-associated protein 52 homolog [Dufourea novaeangliae]KZC07304.1 Vacuolar protein sorting-associated protein 52 like protein [Dufourea novaeangliae]
MSGETDIFDDNESQLPQDLGDDVVQEVLKTGTDLRQYSRQIEKELKEVENKSIQDYIKESENIASLHNQIAACDNILEKMESMLMSFQLDLGSISSEILYLQRKSVAMSQQLSNRQIIRCPLSQFIEDMTVSEALIAGIMDCPVTEKEFLTQLQTLNHKINFVKEQTFKEAKSCLDVKDILEKLKVKAMAKIRTYLLEQIYKFRKPMTNYQVPQNNMLKYKFFFEFILANERNVAEEICGEYVSTMSKIYYSYFKSYSSRLMKLQFEEGASKDDLMGVEDTVGRGIFHKTTLKHRGTVFSIGNRGDVLTSQLEAPIIVPHTASKTRYHYEALFRSEQYALVDNACREYLFLTEFFKVRGAQTMDIFNQVMGKTLNLMVKNLQSFVDDCYDTIALFLCLHLVMRYQLTCHKRAVPALDKYWDNMTSVIWPRFECVFQMNIQSIKDIDPLKLSKETGPHYITRRYAEFSAAMISVVEGFPCEGAIQLLAELREAVQCFLLRMATIFPNRIEQLVFLINNYDLVLGVLMERTRDNSKEAESFREQLNARSAEYVEEVLTPYFGGIIQLVKESEVLIEKGQADDLKRQEGKALALVQSFTNNWKRALEEINREVIKSFPSLVLGTALVQRAMTQLVQYYHRLHKILPPNARTQLTNIHHIMVEIKKYKANY